MVLPSRIHGLVHATPRILLAVGALALGARTERAWRHGACVQVATHGSMAASGSARPRPHTRVMWVGGHCATSGVVCITDAMCGGGQACIDSSGISSWVDTRRAEVDGRFAGPRHNDPAPALMPDVVSNGDGFGVVWIAIDDERSDLWFARVSATGQRVGRPVRLTNTATLKLRPVVVWDGSAYAVAYTELRDDTASSYVIRVAPDGAVRGTPWRIAPDAGFDVAANLVWTGREFASTWYRVDESNGISLRFARWTPDGTRVGAVRVIEPSFLPTGLASLVWMGDGFGVGYSSYVPRDDKSSTLFVRLGAGGEPARPVSIAAASGINGSVSLAWNTRHFGAAWEDGIDLPEEDEPTSAIAFAGVAPTGVVVARRLVSDRAALRFMPALAWGGQSYLLGWTALSGDIKAEVIRVSDAGAVAGPPLVLSGRQPGGLPSIVWTGREYGAAWVDTRAGDLDIFFTRLTVNGARVGSDVQLTGR